jgi:hypothetical protein
MKIYDITLIGKPRMTRADKWKTQPAVMRLLRSLKLCAVSQNPPGVRRAYHLRYANAPELEQKEAGTATASRTSQNQTATTCLKR